MSFRAKVLISITTTVAVAVWLVAWLISTHITRAYEQREAARAATLVAQFRREFERRGAEIAARVDSIAASETITRLAGQLAEPGADRLEYVNEAEAIAREHALDLLVIAAADGTIVSSAQWPARFGYREEMLAQNSDWSGTPVFLKVEELADGTVLSLVAVRSVRSGESLLHVAGGEKLDQRFLEALPAPEGMRVSIHRTADDARSLAPDLASLIGEVRSSGKERARLVTTSAGQEAATAIPLTGRDNQVPAILVAVQGRGELLALRAQVRRTAVTVGASAVLAGVLLGFWSASRVTRPVRRLARSVQQVAGGDWTARAETRSRDEIGQLARDFNSMTEQLVEQRNRMLQAERVAAWREIARRLAHELKNPLFPLQITVENLRRAREAAPADFEEIFEESTTTLLAEINNLKTIIGRFGDFARMPAPQLEAVDVNELAREAMRLFEAQLEAPGRPEVRTHLELAPDVPPIQADPEQLRRALRNLALNALDAMPNGGDLTVRTARSNGRVVIEVADTGQGLTPEEHARLFTPYYTSKQHGTGLGLAIVQSVVSDHHGSISVESEPGHGATFRIELNHEQTAAGG